MKAQYTATARNSLLLASAPEPFAEAMLARATTTHVAHGTTIFAQDEAAEAIYIVLDGWVKLYRITPAGTEAIVGVFTKGHSIGEAIALRGGRYPVFAEAVTDCDLMRINAQVFLDLLVENPGAAIAMLTATYAHLHNLVAQIEQLKAQTGPQRVAEFLLDLSKTELGACSVTLPFDKALIAGRLGMKPESLSRAFAKLKQQGVRVSQDAAEIDDIEALRAYAARDRAEAWHKG
ncbi:MAG: cyclic nucleotide-binding protein [Rhodobacterales bacterium CG2_30_65_12]|nr:MAG: cyclic nucleotide-binding protein [Rhodobacterales bacterium CG2_30_65_12]